MSIEEETLLDQIDPEDLTDLVEMLTRGRPAVLAAAAHIDPASISRYRTGDVTPRPATLERLIQAAGLTAPFVEAILLPAIRAARLARRPLSEHFLEDLEGAVGELRGEVTGAALAQVALFLSQLEEPREDWERDLHDLEDLRARLEPCAPADRLFLVQTCPEFQAPGLMEGLREDEPAR